MAENLSIESPDFDRIRDGNFRAIEDGIRLLWFVANNAERQRRIQDRKISERLSNKVLIMTATTNQDNVDTQGAGLIVYTGGSAIDVSGYRAPSVDGAMLIVLVSGAGTISHLHQSGNSDAGNRLLNNPANTVSAATNEAIIYVYRDSRWRQLVWAT